MPKCSCHRIAPRCEYCRKVSRDNGRKTYSTERRRESARRQRAAKKQQVKTLKTIEAFLELPVRSERRITWNELSRGVSNT